MSTNNYFSESFEEDVFSPIDFRGELNEDQYAAVTSPPGPALVLAGAGSGKTRTLTYRVGWLLSQGVPPQEIMLLTFTNKAAREMLGRVQDLTGVPRHHLWAGTFHHVGQKTLRIFGHEIGLEKNYTIMDEGDAESLLADVVRSIDKEFLKIKGNPKAKILAGIISYARNTQLSVEDTLSSKYPAHCTIVDRIVEFSNAYAKKKLELQVTDYDDLLEHWLKLMKSSEEATSWFEGRFKHVLVDEYQDTNALQSSIIDRVGYNHQIMAVGDDAQCIYTWRGASFDNIMTFPKRHPGTTIHKIVLNYRSTPEILNLANRVLEDRPSNEGYQKDLRAVRSGMTLPILVATMDTRQQAYFICQKLVELHRREGYALQDIAILYRAHYQAMDLQMELSRNAIPYQITSGVRFFAQAHVKDLTSQLRFVSNPGDFTAFQRFACLLPKVGPKSSERIFQCAREVQQEAGVDLIDAMGSETVLNKVPADAREEWPDLVETLRSIRDAILHDSPEAVVRVAVEGWYSFFIREVYTNWTSRMDDLESLVGFATRFTEISEMLSQLVLLNSEASNRSIDPDEDAVRLTTVHQAKGLEFPVVFVIGLSDGGFPLQRAIDEGDVEEERRLFYVAVTRAKDVLYLTYPTIAMIRGGAMKVRPSMFLRNLSQDHYEVHRTHGGISQAGRGAGFAS